jgi:hypothetical protein
MWSETSISGHFCQEDLSVKDSEKLFQIDLFTLYLQTGHHSVKDSILFQGDSTKVPLFRVTTLVCLTND